MIRSLLLGVALALVPASAPAHEALVLLKTECFGCHTPEKRKGGLVMTSREALLAGGDSGPALVPGKPAESYLFELLAADADPHMPPKGQLTDPQIASVRAWIASGAAWDQAALEAASRPGPVELAALPPGYRPVTAMALAPDQTRLAVARGAAVEVWEFPPPPADGAPPAPSLLRVLDGHRDAVQALAWHPDGKLLISGSFRRLLVWDTASSSPAPVRTVEDPFDGLVTAVEFLDADRLVVADSLAARPSHLHVLETSSGKVTRTLRRAHGDTIFDLVRHPDGKRFATASADKLVRLWDAGTWKSVVLESHTGYVQTLAFSPQGDRLASAGEDLAVKVWDLATNKVIHSFTDRKNTGPVTDLAWAVDPVRTAPKPEEGKEPDPMDWLVATSEDGLPRVYTQFVVHDGTQTSGGARATAFPAPEAPVYLSRVAWLPARKQLVFGDASGTLTLRDATGKILGPVSAPGPGS
jgi:mono/diheme cytochrome c family protein